MKQLLYLIFTISLISCTQRVHLEQALKLAGVNRGELEKVLSYYKGDSLKYEAACFLIENMPGKYALVPDNPSGKYKQALQFLPQEDVISWTIEGSVLWHILDSISGKQSWSFHRVEDIKTITAEYLINNIEQSFKVWNMAKRCSFDDFCHYILPYRIYREPLTDWRMVAFRQYGHLTDTILPAEEVARRIVDSGGMRYNIGMNKYPFPLTYEEMTAIRWGTCNDMASFLVLSLRALGIPATIDYVPAWANRSASHCWNVVKREDGSFMEVGFGKDGTNDVVYKVSKIYRKHYALFVRNDVTSDYNMPLSDLDFPLSDFNDGENIMLCTFDNRQWVPVAFAVSKDGKVTFTSVGRGMLWGKNRVSEYQDEGKGIVYLAMQDKDGKTEAVSTPVIVYENGEVKQFAADLSRKEELVLYRKYPLYGTPKENVHDSNEVFPGDTYELFYWDGKWCGLGRKMATGYSLKYDDVPIGALLWLHNYSQGREERIFTYENGRQIWW
ncbi:transglutaminase domain-containing protein [Phocaeicola sp.]